MKTHCTPYQRHSRFVLRVLTTLFVVLFAVYLYLGLPKVKPVADRFHCESNLRELYHALERYISTHGDVPRDASGNASISRLGDPVVQRDIGIASSILRCPADNNPIGPSYLLYPALTIHHFGRDSAVVIACERMPHHPSSGHSGPTRVVLAGDGSTKLMTLPLKEQETWMRLFLSGDDRAARVRMVNGCRYEGTSARIELYTGGEEDRCQDTTPN